MTDPIDFQAARGTGSWERACEQPCLIERVAWDRWTVTFRDSDETHIVQLHTDHGAYLGDCRYHDTDNPCPGWQFQDGPCAHLCAIRRAAFGQQKDAKSNVVRIFDLTDVMDARADSAVEKIVQTDGGYL